MRRPAGIPSQVADPSLWPLAVAAVAAALLAASPDLLARLARLRPLPLHRRIRAHLRK